MVVCSFNFFESAFLKSIIGVPGFENKKLILFFNPLIFETPLNTFLYSCSKTSLGL